VLLGTAGACCWVVAVDAADLVLDPGTIVQPDTDLPAVSGINGKWEFDPGLLTGGGMLRAAGSISIPLGDRFGVQADTMGTWTSNNGFIYSGALHAFTRDPDRYLAGLTGGIVVSPQATLAAVGPEGELYLDQFSLEGWAGLASLNYASPALADKTGAFAIGDLAYYATPDWRFALGGSYMLGDLSVHGSTEYLFHNFGAPVSAVADARYHAGGNYTFTVGVKGYFGGNDDGKSLIRRHREDDPPNRAIDLFLAAAGLILIQPPGSNGPPTIDSEEACISYYGEEEDHVGTGWDPESGECLVNGEIVFQLDD
jgi:hypothetical protein